MQIKKIEPNDVIFHEGEDSQAAYWISSGRVGVTVKTEHGQKMLAQLGPGQLFG
jgi:CRP-like cAMP-binding protein